MPTAVRAEFDEPTNTDNIILAVTSEPIVNIALATDGDSISASGDVVININAEDLTDPEVLDTFLDEALGNSGR